jgi:D-beta-D-heptose 7-phosphate kinase/D-beta-D-heptose 1-phosphate adenosyltransferase
MIAGTHMLLRFDQGSTEAVSEATELRLIDALERSVPACDAVVVSDYGYGILTSAVRAALQRLLSQHARPLLVDAKDLRQYRHMHPHLIKPNYAEAVRLLGEPEVRAPATRVNQLIGNQNALLLETGARIAAVSLDEDGALLLQHSVEPYRVLARTEPRARAAGAGDSFLAALALAIAAQSDPEPAIELATAAAALAVQQDGTAVCSISRLRASITSAAPKLIDRAGLADKLSALKQAGKRIVFTNGCFDIVHRGHTSLLAEARGLGDVLVVGLNSDESVRELKGAGRPINCLADRAAVLSALSCVDYVVPFEEPSPELLIYAFRPDIFVKGGDYSMNSLPEARLVQELGGIVRILGYLDDHSTTGIIEKIWQGEGTATAAEVGSR